MAWCIGERLKLNERGKYMQKILAIDDREDNLISISALLKGLIPECVVITAKTGEDGIGMARKEKPDTILLDIKMPGMDGFEVCKRLKSAPDTRNIPVIMITAVKTDIESKVKALDHGADAFLSKPIDPGELTAQVKAMLRIKKAEDLCRGEKERLEEDVEKRTMELFKSEIRFSPNSAKALKFMCYPKIKSQ